MFFLSERVQNSTKTVDVFSLLLSLSLGGFENDQRDEHGSLAPSQRLQDLGEISMFSSVYMSSNSQEHGRCLLCIKKSKNTEDKAMFSLPLSLFLSQRLQKPILPGHVLSGRITSKMSFLTPDGLSVQINSNV